MSADSDTADRSRLAPAAIAGLMDNLDRILLGAAAAIWLIALGAGVAATVALVDLGRGHPASTGSSTPWLLYTVIGVSAAVIVAAVPLLLRARRGSLPNRAAGRDSAGAAETGASETDAPETGASAVAEAPATTTDAPTEQLLVYRPGGELTGASASAADTKTSLQAPEEAAAVAAVEQLWVRCALSIACTMGVAMIAIGVATYLMAVGYVGVAWGVYGLAGVVTLAMPAIPWFFLRQLRGVLQPFSG